MTRDTANRQSSSMRMTMHRCIDVSMEDLVRATWDTRVFLSCRTISATCFLSLGGDDSHPPDFTPSHPLSCYHTHPPPSLPCHLLPHLPVRSLSFFRACSATGWVRWPGKEQYTAWTVVLEEQYTDSFILN